MTSLNWLSLVSAGNFFFRELEINFSLKIVLLLFISAVDGLIPEQTANDEIQRFRFKNLDLFESMYIMADLQDEIPLFSIKYRSSDGLLLVYPDLNNIDVNPYLKEINFDTRNLYQYAMEDLSTDYHNEITQSLKNDIDLLTNRVKYNTFVRPIGKCSKSYRLSFTISNHSCPNCA